MCVCVCCVCVCVYVFVVIQLGLSTLQYPVSTTSFGGGGGGGSYKTTAFIHGAFNSDMGVDESEGAGIVGDRLVLLSHSTQYLRTQPPVFLYSTCCEVV